MSDMMQSSSTMEAASAPLLPNEMKSPTAYRTISEVADDLNLPQHVLRFWESKFQQIKPLKRGGGRRYYRPEDVQVIHDIKDLLYNQGFTIRGVQKLLREKASTKSYARSMIAEPQLPMSIPTVAPKEERATAPAPVATVATVVAAAQVSNLTSGQRREIEGVLAELKAMRKLLQQSGI